MERYYIERCILKAHRDEKPMVISGKKKGATEYMEGSHRRG